MSELLTFPEMRNRYQNQWLLILCKETDRGFNLISGQVLAHSENRDEIYDAIETLHPRSHPDFQNEPKPVLKSD